MKPDLPTVSLVEDAFYWVEPSYGPRAEQWLVARWSAGSFWCDREEIAPKVTAGPIPNPDEATDEA